MGNGGGGRGLNKISLGLPRRSGVAQTASGGLKKAPNLALQILSAVVITFLSQTAQ